MREIKFRAWDGESMRYDVTGFEHGNKNEMAGVFLDGDFYLIDEVNHSDSGMSIHPSASVMQCTGLKDKNGVEIYEGDILSHWKQGNRAVFYPVSENCAGYGLISADGMKNTLNDSSKLYEVIGNIHQNPDLLK